MIPLTRSGATIVSRLRVVAPGGDPLAARLRAANVLSTASLQPKGLAPSAIVVVRKLVDPLPGTFAARGSEIRPPREWERAVSEAIDRLIRRAARPAWEPVPVDAQAVIFANASEWLACLAADWREGLLTTRWWWRDLLRRTDPTRALLDAWLGTPESVPSALQHLAARGQAIAFAAALTGPNAHAILEVVLARYGLWALRDAVTRPASVPLDDTPPRPSRRLESSPDHHLESSLLGPRRPAAPWAARVPESVGAGLGPAAQSLLGIGLTLARAPAELRTPTFPIAVARWLAWSPPNPNEQDSRTLSNISEALEAPLSPPREPPSIGSSPLPVPPARIGQPPSEAADVPERSGLENPAAPAASSSTSSPGTVLPRAEIRGANAETAQQTLQSSLDDAQAPAARENTGALALPVETEFGGLFYLVNVALSLGLYGDSSMPAGSGIALDLWDFLALVGLRLVGERLRDDPVWPLLAELAGRDERDPPGREFAPDDEWRLPPDWLSAFADEEAWTWDAIERRLRVRHAAGFLVLDIDLGEHDPAKRFADELKVYPLRSLERRPIEADVAEGPLVERWLDRLFPFLHARLKRALRSEDGKAVAPLVCEAPARIYVTSDRLDIMFWLDRLPIEVRLAGLDRDPGWMPDARRSIRFHYE